MITIPPMSQTVVAGSTAVFSVQASGNPTPLTYQWALNGANLAGATSPRLIVTNPTTLGPSTYTVTVSNSFGVTETASAVLTVVTPTSAAGSNPGRLTNESVLSQLTAGYAITLGFISSSAGQRLLIRGVGPGLARFGVTQYITDPSLTVRPIPYDFNLITEEDWGSDATNIMAADSATGAFPLSPGSLDAALIYTTLSASNTAQFGTKNQTGLGLLELYDYSTSTYNPASSPRIINLSSDGWVPAGSVAAAGFVVTGATSKTFLIRAMGPSMIKTFASATSMTNPTLVVVNQQTGALITGNTNWGGDPELAAIANQVTGFPFATPALADSAVVVTLPPGQYTIESASAIGGNGWVLLEIYEVP